ncbi:hypothetical protein BDV98DRAFT_215985 [Pterulicium gracile]|uniref:Secreted protein n=1 Tax=Pterulicium gracile TaxID=1884261 RepID=A0A5C3Q9K3_9AGAR|nr:hypothetical protein BDV98DRAFT_215985 [Pterula gracilis]
MFRLCLFWVEMVCLVGGAKDGGAVVDMGKRAGLPTVFDHTYVQHSTARHLRSKAYQHTCSKIVCSLNDSESSEAWKLIILEHALETRAR